MEDNALNLARLVLASHAGEGAISEFAERRAIDMAARICRAEQCQILPFTGKTRPNPDLPGAA